MKILIIDSLHNLFQEGLIALGHQVIYKPNITLDQLYIDIKDIDALVVRSKFSITKEIIEKAPVLKIIARAGAGMDNVDEHFAKEKNILCIHAGGANADAVGEHAVGMLLMLFNKLKQADSQVRNKIWDREANRGIELKGKNIGIIGFGHTGSALAKKLSGFDVNIYAYDKYKNKFGTSYVKESSLHEIFEHCDIITFHVPLTSETKYMCNQEFIYSFKKNIYIINLSRGLVVNTNDLTYALENNKVLGCVLDVLENEKLSNFTKEDYSWFDKLTAHSNTILSPHVAGWTDESYERISSYLLKSFSSLKV